MSDDTETFAPDSEELGWPKDFVDPRPQFIERDDFLLTTFRRRDEEPPSSRRLFGKSCGANSYSEMLPEFSDYSQESVCVDPYEGGAAVLLLEVFSEGYSWDSLLLLEPSSLTVKMRVDTESIDHSDFECTRVSVIRCLNLDLNRRELLAIVSPEYEVGEEIHNTFSVASLDIDTQVLSQKCPLQTPLA